MKKKILVFVVSLFVVSANAQNVYEEWKPSQDEYANFDIGKYITPNIMRNQLDFNVDFYSNHSRNNIYYADRDDKLEQSNYAGNLSSYFSHYVNTRKIISILLVNFSYSGNDNSQKYKQQFTNNNEKTVENVSNFFQQPLLSLNWSNQWYFSKLFFMDYGLGSQVSYLFRQDKTKNESEDSNRKFKNLSFGISPHAGIGYGRIENVQDARQAVYIANALSKKHVLKRNLSNDELFELSQKISTVKNKRFLDSRLYLIDEITTVDSFFVHNDLLAENGAPYFTTLYDMWQYGDLFTRQSGYKISFGLSPYYNYQNIKEYPENQNTINNSNQQGISLNFNYEKPYKLNWQHSFRAYVFGGLQSSSSKYSGTEDYTDKTKGNTYMAYAAYSLGYFPNTRTNIQVFASQQVSKNTYDNKGNILAANSLLSANFYYYFSSHLRLTGNYNLTYSHIKDNEASNPDRNDFSSQFSVRLTYSMF